MKTQAPERVNGLPYVGLAVIARDEAESIPQMLGSFGVGTDNPAVDYVVVCDTGSKDATATVAAAMSTEKCHVEVVGFEWCDDFGMARQVSWECLPDWIEFATWADCDDIVQGADGLRALAAKMPPEAGATLHAYEYAHDDAGNCVCFLERERLIRFNIGEKWALPVHEVLDVPGGIIRNEDIRWIHQRTKDRQVERNYKILQKDYRRAKSEGTEPDPRTVIYLGSEALGLGKIRPAIKYLREYLGIGGWNDEICQANHKLSIAYRALAAEQDGPEGDPKKRAKALADSRAAAQAALENRPDWADGYLDLAELALVEEDWEKAIRYCDIALERGKPHTLLIVNPMDYEYQPVLMKSVALTHLQQYEEALMYTQKALEVTPFRDDLRGQMLSLSSKLKIKETVRTVLQLRELLGRHDENLKALALLENVPYYVKDHPEIHEALLDQREMVLHAVDPEVYSRYYGDNPNEAFFEQHGLKVEEAHERFPRLAFLRAGLQEQGDGEGLRVLDLSANDGWMAANLSLLGHHVDMMDLNSEAVKRANKRNVFYPKLGKSVCADLHTAAEHFEAGSYDAVVGFETIEHVPDPQRMIDVMIEMCKPDGRVYISTPDGAYEYGNVPGWHVVEHKGHLRAIRPQELTEWMASRGIIEGFMIGQDRVQVGSFRPSPRKGKIVFYAGLTDPAPEKILGGGQGGSETAICKVAEIFARRGYDVRVYAAQKALGLRGDQITVDGDEPLKGQVLYGAIGDWDPGEECDLFVSARVPEAFDRSINCKTSVLWLHDADYGDRLTAERAARADHVLVMSAYQKRLLKQKYPFLGNLKITRNGIETRWFEKLPRSKKPQVVYSSSPDRGLDVLLELWPAIKAAVPEAELHHTYAPVYAEFAKIYPHLAKLSAVIEGLSKTDGVVAHGHMGQRELANLFLESRVWAYPSWTTPAAAPFPEISCISAMEAQAAGCVPVFLNYAALQETVRTGVPVGPDKGIETWTELSDEWRDEFVEAVVRGLTSDSLRRTAKQKGPEWALTLGWEGVVDEWENDLVMSEPKPVSASNGSGLLIPSAVG